ncbi:MAG: type II toxin-antitoxin system HicB family antitoxin [Planctomycetes bacterium]|nr:type II toxin-antitoxin system HicB family antitoxin [Planctomycetota bacterium]
MMEYKGYVGQVEFDDDAGIFHGEVANTRDVITFQGETVEELRKAFRDSVDDYLAFCDSRGESPDKPFSGQFVTRISPELHRKLNAAASLAKQSLNSWVAEQLDKAAAAMLKGDGPTATARTRKPTDKKTRKRESARPARSR